jgi:hypothetical protein
MTNFERWVRRGGFVASTRLVPIALATGLAPSIGVFDNHSPLPITSTSASAPRPVELPMDTSAMLPVSFTSASKPKVAALTMDGIEQLTSAAFVEPSRIKLEFVDRRSFVLPIELLGMPADRIDWQTLKASPDGEKIVVKGIKGDPIPIDSGTLRYLVDEKYAAKIDKSIRDLHIPIEEARSATVDAPIDPRWADVDDDDLFE